MQNDTLYLMFSCAAVFILILFLLPVNSFDKTHTANTPNTMPHSVGAFVDNTY